MSTAIRNADGIPFVKMTALGNDFIIVDDRDGILAGRDIAVLARKLCAHRLSLGGDQLMIVAPPVAGGDFLMRTINPDGTEVKMCGNASRCVARFAADRGLAGAAMRIDTPGGPVTAEVRGSFVRVGLALTAPARFGIPLEIRKGQSDVMRLVADWFEVSGAPHAVIRMGGAADAPDERIHALGAAVRRHPEFPGGANVNFIEPRGPHEIAQRTYERGIEGETLACGTGATASALAMAAAGLAESPVRVAMRGGAVEIGFVRDSAVTAGTAAFRAITLGGETRYVASGTLHPEAWKY